MSIELKDKLVTLESLGAVYQSEVEDRNAAISAEATARAEAISAETAARTEAIANEVTARNAAIVEAINQAETGAPTKVELVSQMTDPDKNYLYIGEEQGYNSGHIYYLVDGVPVDKGVFGGTNIDDTLTISGQAADAKVTGDKIEEIKEDLSSAEERITALEDSSAGGLSEEAKQALLTCFTKVAWIDEHGQDCYDDLYDALYPPARLVGISVVFDSSIVIRSTNTLDDLRQYLTVTAIYSDHATVIVTDYTLSGVLEEGTSVITVSYGDKLTTFNVTVHNSVLYRLENTLFNGVDDYIDTGIKLRENNIDFTIAVSLKNDDTTALVSNATVLHCMHEINPWPGVSLAKAAGASSAVYRVGGLSTGSIGNTQCSTNKGASSIIIVRYDSATLTFTIDSKNVDADTIYPSLVYANIAFKSVTESTLIGCYKDAEGVLGRFWNGMINELIIDSKVWTDDEVNAYLGGV